MRMTGGCLCGTPLFSRADIPSVEGQPPPAA
jgi:hypothetical protein